MAIYKNGINGAFSGKLGTVVGVSWRGVDYMRSLPRKPSAGKTPMNEAISFIFKNALVGEGSEKRIDFSRVVFSRGELFISIVKEVVALVDLILHIKWDNVAASVFNQGNDLVTFIWYCPQKEKFVTFKDAAQRGDQEAVLQLPVGFEGQELHGYMQYVNAAGDLVSTSLYLGTMQV